MAVTVATAAWPVVALVLLAAVVVVVSLKTTLVGAVLAALQCWGLYATFMVGPSGDLTFNDQTRWVLFLMLQLAVLATLASATVRLVAFVAGAPRPSPVRS